MKNLHQQQYWEAGRARRHPSHPVIRAFAEPKAAYIRAALMRHQRDVPDRTLTLLDVGCGNGFLTYYLDRDYAAYSLDYSRFMLSINPCERKICGSAMALPFPDNAFDIVCCSNLLHHLADPAEAVAEMRRVSRTYVILSEPNRNNPLMFLFNLLKKEERGALKFSEGFLKRLAEQCRLTIIASASLGMILPNKTPEWMLPVLTNIDGESPLAFYALVVCQK